MRLLLWLLVGLSVEMGFGMKLPEGGFQACPQGRGGTVYRMPNASSINCTQKAPDVNEWKGEVTLLRPKRSWPTIPAIRCALHRREILTHRNFLGATGIYGDHSISLPVSVQDCLFANRTSTFQGQRLALIPGLPGTVGTNNNAELAYPYCCKMTSNNVYNFYIESGQVSSGDGESLSSTLGPLGGCKLKDNFCALDDGVVAWESRAVLQQCLFEPVGKFNATLSHNTSLFVDDANVDFNLNFTASVTAYPCLPNNSVLTEEAFAVVFHSKRPWKRPFSSVSRLLREENSLAAWKERVHVLSNKVLDSGSLNRVARYATETSATVSQKASLGVCRLKKASTAATIVALKSNPTETMRSILQTDKISARLQGDVVIVSPCVSINVVRSFPDHRLPGDPSKCYRFLPVQLASLEFMFVSPGSRDLISHSPPMPCEDAHEPIFHYSNSDGVAYFGTSKGAVHVEDFPDVFHAQVGQAQLSVRQPHFSSKAVYRSALPVPVAGLADYIYHQHQMEAVLSRTVDQAASFSLDPAGAKAAIEGAAEGVMGAAGGLVNGFAQKLTNPVLGLVKNCLLTLALILAAISLVPWVWRNRAFLWQMAKRIGKRLCSRGSSSTCKDKNADVDSVGV
jgi:hypothetical protein